MGNNNYFRLESKRSDIPFYNGIPQHITVGCIVILSAIALIFFALTFGVGDISGLPQLMSLITESFIQTVSNPANVSGGANPSI